MAVVQESVSGRIYWNAAVILLLGVVAGCAHDNHPDNIAGFSSQPQDTLSAHAGYCGIPDVVSCDWIMEVINYLGYSDCPHLGDMLMTVWNQGGFRLADFSSITQSGGADLVTQEIYIDIDFIGTELPWILAHEAHHLLYNSTDEVLAYSAESCVAGIPGWQ